MPVATVAAVAATAGRAALKPSGLNLDRTKDFGHDHDNRAGQAPGTQLPTGTPASHGVVSMTIYQPATAASNALVRPPCTRCGTPTLLVGIESDKPGFDLNTFECPKCGQLETTVTVAGAL